MTILYGLENQASVKSERLPFTSFFLRFRKAGELLTARTSSSSTSHTSRSLAYMLRAMSIKIENIWANLAYAPRGKTMNGGGRLTDTFVELVAKNHIQHREIEFYADHLGLTSKYLSTTIKKESGKSAAEWIVSYVLLEAKYYLRQTNSPIKQIAFELNFANQMDFYRYFLRHTGMTPSEYRNLPGC